MSVSSLLLRLFSLEGRSFPVNSRSDSLMCLSDVIRSLSQALLTATKQKKKSPQPPHNPLRAKAETV